MNWKNLEDYPLKDLQKMWLDYFDKPYCSNSKAFFVSRIGYRLQELKYGGLPNRQESSQTTGWRQ